jgi:hypothetical protein
VQKKTTLPAFLTNDIEINWDQQQECVKTEDYLEKSHLWQNKPTKLDLVANRIVSLDSRKKPSPLALLPNRMEVNIARNLYR